MHQCQGSKWPWGKKKFLSESKSFFLFTLFFFPVCTTVCGYCPSWAPIGDWWEPIKKWFFQMCSGLKVNVKKVVFGKKIIKYIDLFNRKWFMYVCLCSLCPLVTRNNPSKKGEKVWTLIASLKKWTAVFQLNKIR